MSSGPVLPRFEPLGPHHDRAAFSCRHPDLERYLKQVASQDQRRGLSATTVLLVDSDTRIAGYHTLSSTRLDLGELPEELASKYPKYREGIGATLLGRLALDEAYVGSGWGRRLLMNALDRALYGAQTVASAFVIVRAIDDEAYRFYEHFGFEPLPSDRRRLLLPMKTLAALVSGPKRR